MIHYDKLAIALRGVFQLPNTVRRLTAEAAAEEGIEVSDDMRAKASARGYEEQLRLLEKAENDLAGALVTQGLSPVAARMSAFAFVSQCVSRFAAEQ